MNHIQYSLNIVLLYLYLPLFTLLLGQFCLYRHKASHTPHFPTFLSNPTSPTPPPTHTHDPPLSPLNAHYCEQGGGGEVSWLRCDVSQFLLVERFLCVSWFYPLLLFPRLAITPPPRPNNPQLTIWCAKLLLFSVSQEMRKRLKQGSE